MSTTIRVTGPAPGRYPYTVTVYVQAKAVAGGEYATADEARDVARLSARCWGGVVQDDTQEGGHTDGMV